MEFRGTGRLIVQPLEGSHKWRDILYRLFFLSFLPTYQFDGHMMFFFSKVPLLVEFLIFFVADENQNTIGEFYWDNRFAWE